MKLKIIYFYLLTLFQTKLKSKWFNQKLLDFRLKRNLRFIAKNSKFYQRYRNQNIKEYPIINKSIIMDNFSEHNTQNLNLAEVMRIALKAEEDRDFSPVLNQVTIGLSSGTSGHRGIFLATRNERAIWAGTILAKHLPYSLLKKEKIALFLRANSNLYETVGSKNIQFAFFDLMNEINSNLKSLEKFDPTIIVAPPSMLREISKQFHRLKISPIKIRSIAEVLESLDEAIICRTFDLPVHQIYQCTEGFLAATCSHGGLHLNEEYLYIEKKFIDKEKTKFIPIITDTLRRAQPIIRYELNDILILSKDSCRCGSPNTLLESIEGRCDDIFKFNNSNNSEVIIFPDFIRRAVLKSSSSIEEYKITQISKTQLDIALISHKIKEDTELVIEGLTDLLSKLDISPPKYTSSVYRANQGYMKLRRIESLI